MQELGKEIVDGEVFIFVNRTYTHLKLLLYEQGLQPVLQKVQQGHLLSSRPLTMTVGAWPPARTVTVT